MPVVVLVVIISIGSLLAKGNMLDILQITGEPEKILISPECPIKKKQLMWKFCSLMLELWNSCFYKIENYRLQLTVINFIE